MCKLCGAKTKSRAGAPCRKVAGWGTDHVGSGRCRLHGGSSTGPRDQFGNKNALRTGEYESLLFENLDSREQAAYRELPVDPIPALEEELRLTTIRELRMLKRIAELKAAEDDDGMIAIEISRNKGVGSSADTDGGNPIDITTTKRRGVLGQIQDIEEALTRVQLAKARLMEALLKARAQDGTEPEESGLAELAEALDAAAADAWAGADEDQE